jgi:hypothetical protein
MREKKHWLNGTKLQPSTNVVDVEYQDIGFVRHGQFRLTGFKEEKLVRLQK